jgi:hypothetical protein
MSGLLGQLMETGKSGVHPPETGQEDRVKSATPDGARRVTQGEIFPAGRNFR